MIDHIIKLMKNLKLLGFGTAQVLGIFSHSLFASVISPYYPHKSTKMDKYPRLDTLSPYPVFCVTQIIQQAARWHAVIFGLQLRTVIQLSGIVINWPAVMVCLLPTLF